MDKIVIADTQVVLNAPDQHLRSLSKYIWEHKPKDIVHIGDHWDFPSLSSYASILDMEGRRLIDDLQGGLSAFELIMEETNNKNRLSKRTPYKPNKHFIMGNHEFRLNRFIERNPILAGFVDLKYMIKVLGWAVNDYLDPLWIDEICFIHYLPNPESSRAVGGSIENKLNKFPHCFIHGHQQKYQYGRRQNLQGKPHFGVCAGSFYMHDEGYRGANNTEIRGFVHLHHFKNRYGFDDYDVEFVSMERLIENY